MSINSDAGYSLNGKLYGNVKEYTDECTNMDRCPRYNIG